MGDNRGVLAVISGFSGAGKGTLIQMLLSRYEHYALSVSATTRKPREGEREGVHYFFKTKEQFEEMISRDELLEYANYVGNYYGTPKEYVLQNLDEGRDVLLEIEIQGALQIKKKYPEAVLIFIMPPSAGELLNRLSGRGTEDEETIRKRLGRAVRESEGIESYDFVLVNDDLSDCAERLNSLIRSMHFRTENYREFISDIRREMKQFE